MLIIIISIITEIIYMISDNNNSDSFVMTYIINNILRKGLC